MTQYFGQRKIVSTSDNVITFKGGEQLELTRNQQHYLIDTKLSTEEEFQEKKYHAVMNLMTEIYDTLDLTLEEFNEGIGRFFASITKKQQVAIATALGIPFDEAYADQALKSIKYKDILRNIEKKA